MQDQKKPDVTFRGVPVVFDDELPMAKAADPMQAFGNPLTGPLNAVPAGREVIVPGTALTVGAVARLENAAANLVAVANLYSEEAQRTFADPTFLPEPVVAAISKINGILAGPGPVALDMRPNSVEVHGDPVLHEKALLEAKAREQAREMVSPQVLGQAAAYESRTEAHRQDVADSFEEGKARGYERGLEDGRAHGEQMACITLNNLSLWQLLKRWWAGQRSGDPIVPTGSVGGIDRSQLNFWLNSADVTRELAASKRKFGLSGLDDPKL